MALAVVPIGILCRVIFVKILRVEMNYRKLRIIILLFFPVVFSCGDN